MPQKQVYLFGTCLIDVFYPASGLDAVSLLEFCGYEVIFPQAQTCCGQPPFNSGYTRPTIKIAEGTIRTFSAKDIPFIVPSASCAGMIKLHYPSLFKQDSREHQLAMNLANRTYELIDFIVDKLPYEAQIKSPHCKVSLHESCCAQRELKVSKSWQRALERLDNVEVCFPLQREECCGFGGTFAVKSEAISAAMTHDKCTHLLAHKSDYIVSGDSGCLMNIGAHLSHQGHKNNCTHLARFIAQRFGIENEE